MEITDEAVQFFAVHGTSSFRPGETTESAQQRAGRELAAAEAEAKELGWEVVWSLDPDADNEPTKDYLVSGYPQWEAVLVSGSGESLASLCSIDMGDVGECRDSAPYYRVVNAELAGEALRARKANHAAALAGDGGSGDERRDPS